MLKAVEVKGLFGTFSYRFDLKDGGITILTGPNGFGKSTILGLISAVAAGDVYALIAVPFDELTLHFAKNKKFRLKKTDAQLCVDGVTIEISDPAVFRGVPLSAPESSALILRRLRNAAEDAGGRVSTDEAAALLTKLQQLKNSCLSAAGELGAVKFIRDQRLSGETDEPGSRNRIVKTVAEIPKRLEGKIDDALYAYTDRAETLDESFPARLLADKTSPKRAAYDALNKRLNALRARLVRYGLIPGPGNGKSQPYDERFALVLQRYAADQVEKLEAFLPLLDRLDTFSELINEKLRFKKLMISRNGIQVTDTKTGTLRLPLTALSSGEQQIIVFYYELIFESGDKSMLLIDEPEISLHIAWQLELIDDLKRILDASSGETEIIIATHSPQVLTGNWDLQVDLGEMYAD